MDGKGFQFEWDMVDVFPRSIHRYLLSHRHLKADPLRGPPGVRIVSTWNLFVLYLENKTLQKKTQTPIKTRFIWVPGIDA